MAVRQNLHNINLSFKIRHTVELYLIKRKYLDTTVIYYNFRHLQERKIGVLLF